MELDVKALKKTTLAHVAKGEEFHVCRGDWISNIYDLTNCIESLTPDQFRSHVNPNGPTNHFSLWIRQVLKNPLLANDLMLNENLRDQKHFVKTLRDHVAWLERS